LFDELPGCLHQANEEYLYRLLRYLAQFGLFVEEEGRAFKLTSLSTHLRYVVIVSLGVLLFKRVPASQLQHAFTV
jgi:hypothetical protein